MKNIAILTKTRSEKLAALVLLSSVYGIPYSEMVYQKTLDNLGITEYPYVFQNNSISRIDGGSSNHQCYFDFCIPYSDDLTVESLKVMANHKEPVEIEFLENDTINGTFNLYKDGSVFIKSSIGSVAIRKNNMKQLFEEYKKYNGDIL